jgi:hypothetical protein
METKRWWIVGHDDKAWGPFERAPLAALAAEGKLRADGLVCSEGESRWFPIGTVADLAEITWPPAAPVRAEAPAAAVRQPPLAPAANMAALRPNELDPIPGWATVLLSIPTLGLWGTFNFYRTMRVYRRLSLAGTTHVETLFWAMLCVTALGVITLPVGIGFVLLIAAVVIGALLVKEALRLRDLAIVRLVPQAASVPAHYPPVKSDDWHFGLWITGAVLTITGIFAIVGVPILIAQALAWFEDWNRLAAIARGATAGQPALSA